MKKKSTALVVFLFSVAIVISVCVVPAFAKIKCESNATFDYNGTSACYGEEIQVKTTINPGESEVKDMRIDILEADALIDDNSFDKTISPAWASVNLTQEGHTFFCDELKKGESITLMFNAYPKTIKEGEIKVADVRVRYTQLGQRLEDWGEVKADLKKSFWFRYEDAEKRVGSANWMFYVGIILAIIACVSLFIQWVERRGKEEESEEMRKDFYEKLKNIYNRLESAEDNEMVNRSEIVSLKMSVKSYMEEYKPKEGGEE